MAQTCTGGHRAAIWKIEMTSFVLNGKEVTADVAPDTPLLWVVRDHFELKGSKFGCGLGLCGACTMHVNDLAMRTCVLPVSAIEGAQVTSIEGLVKNDTFAPLLDSWVDISVPQCGYCQSGQIMSAAALLAKNDSPSDGEIGEAMQGNICRCGTYPRIRRAIKTAAVGMKSAATSSAEADG
jgi:isoquinoline 1-oxidoreductase alpha subunit